MSYENLERYLEQSRGLSWKSIEKYCRDIQHFQTWLEKENVPVDQVRKADIIGYITHQKKRDLSSSTIAHMVAGLRHYFSFQVEKGIRKNNPATGIYIRGKRSTVPVNLLKPSELEQLYKDFPQDSIIEYEIR